MTGHEGFSHKASSRASVGWVKIAKRYRATWMDLEKRFCPRCRTERPDRMGIAPAILRVARAFRGRAMPTPRSGYAYAFFATGTGMPAILRLTEFNVVRLVKNNVFQSSPPKPRLVVAG